MGSRAVNDTVVYRQTTQPADTREGVLWVDTSGTGTPDTKVYGDGSWSPIADIPLLVNQELVTFGESGADLSHLGTIVQSGQVELSSGESSTGSNTNQNSMIITGSSPYGVRYDLPNGAAEISVDLEGNLGSGTCTLKDMDGNVLDTDTGSGTTNPVLTAADSFPGRVDVLFQPDDGDSQYVTADEDVAYQTALSGVDADGGTRSDGYNIMGLTVTLPETQGEATIGWASIPDDLTAWDLISWQYDEGAGSMSFDVETNDGSGWAVHRSDVLPPVGISTLAPDTDVRVVANLSRAAVTDTTPVVPYAARRGER